jgi:hypothetical protein
MRRCIVGLICLSVALAGMARNAGASDFRPGPRVTGLIGDQYVPWNPQPAKPAKFAVVLLSWSDGPAAPWPASRLRNVLTGGGRSVERHLAEASNGVVRFRTAQNTPGVDIFGWYQLPYSSTSEASCDDNRLQADAIAKAKGVNLDAYDKVAIVVPSQHCFWAGLGDYYGGKWLWISLPPVVTDYWYSIFIHELGHTYRMGHSQRLVCRNKQGGQVAFSAKCEDAWFEPWDPMGAGAYNYSALHQAQAGFLPSRNVRVVDRSQTIYLRAVERRTATGAHLLLIPTDDSAVRFYAVEFHVAAGAISNFPANRAATRGLMIRRTGLGDVDTKLLDLRPGTPGVLKPRVVQAPNDAFADGTLRPGSTFTDPVSKRSIKLLSYKDGIAIVHVSIPKE